MILKKIKKCFTEHPKKVGETYFQHLKCASKMAWETGKISSIMMVHAICPFLCEYEASQRLEQLNKKIQKRKGRDEQEGCCNCNCN